MPVKVLQGEIGQDVALRRKQGSQSSRTEQNRAEHSKIAEQGEYKGMEVYLREANCLHLHPPSK
jgi:hypothetical protein